uniref:Protein AHC1 n=1 Tax=Talaromyces marneffei PM1 TaxID=1077442 RepID=A0A093VFH3_TALMA
MALSHGVFRLLPWTSSLGVNKIAPDMLVSTAPHKSPVMGSAPLQLLKRKRSDSHEIFTVIDEPLAKRLQSSNQPLTELNGSNNANLPTPPSQDEANLDSTQSAPTKTNVASKSTTTHSAIHEQENPSKRASLPPKPANIDINVLRQSLDAQLSLEVLLKHNELRLIDQEIAKCQVALEQLRRCAEMPYPGSSVDGISQSVSDGSGFAVPYSGTGPPPASPAPWGVADGPYSRHYAKWLLPDPRFDGGESPDLPPPNAASSESRYTRGTFTENGYVAGKSRAQRGSISTRLQSLPNGYPVVKEKAGPMVIKRKSDNKQVKLVCLDCRRFDFSSTQGFINHCRIAHSRTFASHDAAAEACGEPVDVDEAGAVIGGTAPSEPPIIANPGSVHPLIRTAHAIEKTLPLCNETPSKAAKPKKKGHATPSSPFKASPATPHLSSMLAGLGSKLNLDQIVGDAKTTVDLSEFMSEGESEDEETSEPQVGTGARLPARTTMPQAASQRPTSSKRHEVSLSQGLEISTPTKMSAQYQTFLPGVLPLEESGATDLIHMDDNLSPVTVESHQAPSLVSDNEDDEFEAASDSDSFSSRSSDDGHDDEDDDDDIEVEDDEASTTSTKTPHEVTSFRRSQDKKRDRVLPPAIVSLNPGGKRQNSKSKKAGNQKKGD